MTFRLVGDVLVTVHGPESPTDEEWEEYLDVGLDIARNVRSMPFARQLVITDGAMPSLRQQARVHRRVRTEDRKAFRMPVAVVTDAAAIRMMAALNRGRLAVRTFASRQARGALDWLVVDAAVAQTIAAMLPDMRREVGGCQVVDEVLRAIRQIIASDDFAQRLERERASIARELEAGLGEELRSMLRGLDDLRGRVTREERDELDHLAARIADAGQELGGIVWALEADAKPWSSVSLYVHDALRGLAGDRLHAEITGPRDQMIPSAVALHLLRITQEAVRNAIVHARTPVVSARLRCESTSVLAVVSDGGHGIPDEFLSRDFGGLHHIRTRASLCGGCAELATGARGTRWHVALPLRP